MVSLSFTFSFETIPTTTIVVVVVVVVVVFTFTRIIKSVVTGQASVTLEWRNTPEKRKHNHNQKWYTLIS